MTKLRTKRLNRQSQQRSKLFAKISKEIERRQSLTQQIKTDVRDPDVLSYIQSLSQELQQLPPLEPFDLKTTESALAALTMINRTQGQVERLLKNARALRTLLEQERGEREI